MQNNKSLNKKKIVDTFIESTNGVKGINKNRRWKTIDV